MNGGAMLVRTAKEKENQFREKFDLLEISRPHFDCV